MINIDQQAKRINDGINFLGNLAFVIPVIITMFRTSGYGFANIINNIIQVLISFSLFILIFYILPKYHDENLKVIDYKKIGNYSQSVVLLSKIDLLKLFERVISVTLINIMFFLSEGEKFIKPWSTILIGIFLCDLFIWVMLKYFKKSMPKTSCGFTFTYIILGKCLFLMMVNLITPLFLIAVNLTQVMTQYELVIFCGILIIIAILILYKYFKRK
ncbi:hypothetical protein [Streptococcus sp. zg-JUN1979]|uniref:hypothetical protein n=1 Tax=Streptococcus sp. zg-JUN1979 TaxID=3391450 RepID=UPI0039A416A0